MMGKLLAGMALGLLMAFGLVSLASAQDASGSANAGGNMVYQYRLGSGDKVRVIVFGEDALGGEFSVSGEGKVSLPLIGDVPAVGLTAAQLQANIQDLYKQGYLRDPKVNVEVLNFRPFYILGEVKKPGEYPYGNGMTVMNAVALAEGYTYRADQKRVYIKRANSGEEQQIPLKGPVVVQPGDTIRIAERYF